MALSTAHRRFLLIDQALVPAIFNIVLNGAIAWLLLRHNPFLTVWGDGAIGPDLLITGFLLAFLSCAIVTRLVTGKIQGGAVSRLAPEASAHAGLHLRSTWVRAGILGLVGIILGALPAIGALSWLGLEPMTVPFFVTFKALWTGLLAAALTPIIAWWALLAASTEPVT